MACKSPLLPITVPLITAEALVLYAETYSDDSEAATLWPSFALDQPVLCGYLMSRREMFSDDLAFRKFCNGAMFVYALIQLEKRMEPPYYQVTDDTEN